MKYFYIDEQSLIQIKSIVMEIPTKFGVPLGNILDRALQPYEPSPPTEEAGSDGKDLAS